MRKKWILTLGTLALLLAIVGGGIASANGPSTTTTTTPTQAANPDRFAGQQGQQSPADHLQLANRSLGSTMFKAIADKLGMTLQELTKEMHSGKSILVIADEKSVTQDELVQAVVDSEKGRLQEAVDGKKMTAEQMTWLLDKLQERAGKMLLQEGTGRLGTPMVQKAEWDTVAQALGMTTPDLRQELRTRTLAAIAEEKGVALNDLVQTMVTARQSALASLVSDGNITQAQADAALAKVQTAWQNCADNGQGLSCHWGFTKFSRSNRGSGGHRGFLGRPGYGRHPKSFGGFEGNFSPAPLRSAAGW